MCHEHTEIHAVNALPGGKKWVEIATAYQKSVTDLRDAFTKFSAVHEALRKMIDEEYEHCKLQHTLKEEHSS